MRIPQVNDRMKEAPAQALRAFFSGIGQFLLAAEKTTDQAGEAAQDAAAARQAEGSYSARWRSLDKTGNVRILEPDELGTGAEAGDAAPAAKTATAARPEPEPAAEAAARPAAETTAGPAARPAAETTAGPAARPAAEAASESAADAGAAVAADQAELPVPGYDSLSLPSVRARLRLLDRDQVAALLGHEQARAGRPEFLTMLERRVAKLDGASPAGASPAADADPGTGSTGTGGTGQDRVSAGSGRA